MANDIKFRDILYDDRQIGPYPSNKLKRVDELTVKIVNEPQRRSSQEDAMAKAASGEYGEKIQERFALMMTMVSPLDSAFIDMQFHYNTIKQNPVESEKAPIPDNPRVLSRHLKSLGHFLGADQVGICKLDQAAVYTHDQRGTPIEADYKYAIVLANRMDMSTIGSSNGHDWITNTVSFQAYQRLASQTQTIANYIRRLGYEADASHLFKYQNMMVPLILSSGLGELSKMSLVVNPFFGAYFKTAAILTNIPLEIDKPIDFGLQQYCENCTICEDVCRVNAIKGEKKIYNGYECWEMDRKVCTSFVAFNPHGGVCGRCVKSCPWSRINSDPRDFENWDGSIETLHALVDEEGQTRRANDFKMPGEETDQWWFDLERTSPADQTLKIHDKAIPGDYSKYNQ